MKDYRSVPKSGHSSGSHHHSGSHHSSSSSRSSHGSGSHSSSHHHHHHSSHAPNETQAVESFHTRPAEGPKHSSHSSSRSKYSYETAFAGPAHESKYRSPSKSHHSSHSSSHHSSSSRSKKSGGTNHLKSIIGMALSISALAFCWLFIYGKIYAVAAGIVGICLARSDAKSGVTTGSAFRKAAYATGIVAIVIGAIFITIWIIGLIGAASLAGAMRSMY